MTTPNFWYARTKRQPSCTIYYMMITASHPLDAGHSIGALCRAYAERAGPAAAARFGGTWPTTRAAASPAPACGAPKATSRRPQRCCNAMRLVYRTPLTLHIVCIRRLRKTA